MTKAKSYSTLQDAIEALLAELDPGAELWLHEEDCNIERGENCCTCLPRKLTREVAKA